MRKHTPEEKEAALQRRRDKAREASRIKREDPEYCEQMKIYLRQYYRDNKEKSWAARGIDITQEAYDALLQTQNYRCAVCHNEPDRRGLCVDHDHNDGRIRGLLCHGCNLAIGNLKDNPAYCRSAAEYLERK